MGIFDRFKKKEKEVKTTERNVSKSKIVMVDQVYLLDVPEDWNQFESDRFRMKNQKNTLQFSATNYGKELSKGGEYSISDLKPEIDDLFVKFEKEGDYEPINDRINGKDFIYQAFKVDSETQYYFYTFRKAIGQLIRINFIIREVGEYKKSTSEKMLKIGDSIKIKVG
ncbi:hypothetical protein [uncultured Algibacter sp.]|uniref:hypothetical protein n=1 Tax=uncultured Algibacter sp. TaxID=298659 RepID=UPI002629583A|nr:hypothetical protein [uncultured Algibacter sp.]